jgi:hypothetical protein
VVYATPKAADRTTVTVSHERLPDSATADELKTSWRGWLAALKATVEGR